MPEYLPQKVLTGYKTITREEPVYEWREQVVGHKLEEQRVPNMVEKQVKVGTRVEWTLVDKPEPAAPPPPAETPEPTETPTPPPTAATPYPSPTPDPNSDNRQIPVEPSPIITQTPPPISDPYHSVPSGESSLWNRVIGGLSVASEYVDTANDIRRISQAGGQVSITTVDDIWRVYGSRANRATLGFNPYTNRISPSNASRLFQGVDELAMRSAVSSGTLLGLLTNTAANTHDLATGDIDRFEYAAAMTVDTGATIGTALAAGFIAGAASGALVGGTFGFVVGAVPAAIIGGVLGAGVALGAILAFESTGARDYVVDEVADMYRRWVLESG